MRIVDFSFHEVVEFMKKLAKPEAQRTKLLGGELEAVTVLTNRKKIWSLARNLTSMPRA